MIDIFGLEISSAIFWLILAGIFGLTEAFTMGLTTIWFTGGALVAAVIAMAGFSVPIQVVIFFAVSIILIIFTRPLAKKKLKIGSQKTNVDALAGREALVVKTIMPFDAGQAKVDGIIWTAISGKPDLTLEEGTTVRIDHVQGVKLVVIPWID